MAELWQLSAAELSSSIKQRQISAVESYESALQRLNAVNPELNAVVQVCDTDAKADAAALDAKILAGEDPGCLAGVPVTVKVNIDQKGYANTNGLRLQKDNIAFDDHPVVTNLKRAGAIIIGRTNTPAFSIRWFTRNSLHGSTLNPVNRELTPGGSSGGAASAVAAGIGAIAHGTDIAGSIRYPAYACGVHGLRTSLGRVAAYNASAPDRLIAGQLMAVSGPMARTIDDLELGLKALSARDARDPWWVPVPLEFPSPEKKCAVCIAPEQWKVNTEVVKAVEEAAVKLGESGWTIEEVKLPPIREAADMNIMLWMADMSRVGESVVDKEGDADAIFVFKQLNRLSKSVNAAELMDIMQSRATLVRQWQLFLEDYPLVLCPVSSELPFANHSDVESEESFDAIFEAQLLQIGLPFLGIPALTVTTGRVNNVPVGVQLIADRFREDILLSAGRDLENAFGKLSIAMLDE